MDSFIDSVEKAKKIVKRFRNGGMYQRLKANYLDLLDKSKEVAYDLGVTRSLGQLILILSEMFEALAKDAGRMEGEPLENLRNIARVLRNVDRRLLNLLRDDLAKVGRYIRDIAKEEVPYRVLLSKMGEYILQNYDRIKKIDKRLRKATGKDSRGSLVVLVNSLRDFAVLLKEMREVLRKEMERDEKLRGPLMKYLRYIDDFTVKTSILVGKIRKILDRGERIEDARLYLLTTVSNAADFIEEVLDGRYPFEYLKNATEQMEQVIRIADNLETNKPARLPEREPRRLKGAKAIYNFVVINYYGGKREEAIRGSRLEYLPEYFILYAILLGVIKYIIHIKAKEGERAANFMKRVNKRMKEASYSTKKELLKKLGKWKGPVEFAASTMEGGYRNILEILSTVSGIRVGRYSIGLSPTQISKLKFDENLSLESFQKRLKDVMKDIERKLHLISTIIAMEKEEKDFIVRNVPDIVKEKLTEETFKLTLSKS